jgi:RHS repeat-associated protein
MLSNGPGNITSDGVNAYLYDAEDRLCAVHGAYGMVGYQYDAEGNRISKGSITIWSCDITSNGFQPQSDYILDQGGGQETEMAVDAVGTEVWQHTNVWAAGQLIATYDTAGQHFYFNDALGSRRYQTDSAGVLEQTCQSLPFGDNLQCSGSTSAPTEHHFTGKERDPESGLDFFMARYYASNMGRFMSPDWSAKIVPVPYASLDAPQSLNLYSYVQNNALSRIDNDGHETETYDLPGLNRTARQNENDKRISPTEWKIWGGVALGVGALSGASEIAAVGQAAVRIATGLCLLHCAAIAEHVLDAVNPNPAPIKFSSMGTWVAESRAGWSNAAIAYQNQIGGVEGKAFLVNGVKFDGVNAVEGFLEAKSERYGYLLSQKFGGNILESFAKAGRRQLVAAQGAPITWHFADEGAANAARSFFQKQGIGIKVVYTAAKK